tara:strand:- start:339 stop:524 length:186 start_codon:yes stop_codon:yes gene_type:complete
VAKLIPLRGKPKQRFWHNYARPDNRCRRGYSYAKPNLSVMKNAFLSMTYEALKITKIKMNS